MIACPHRGISSSFMRTLPETRSLDHFFGYTCCANGAITRKEVAAGHPGHGYTTHLPTATPLPEWKYRE